MCLAGMLASAKLGLLKNTVLNRNRRYPRRARSALGVDTVLTLDVCMFVCLYVCMFVCLYVCMLVL